MILFPNCKINLGLRVTGKREDGYHNLETIFYPLPLKDAVELTSTSKPGAQQFELIISGLDIPGDRDSNLCLKAWQLIRQDFPVTDCLRMHLLKAIPIGAGLGGGSSDGAHTLLLLNEQLQLGLTVEELMNYALKLGSDCPFFILNKTCLVTGRGNILTGIQINLHDHYFVVVNPEVHISTAWAFGRLPLHETIHSRPLTEIVALPVEQWKNHLVNDFEAVVFEEYESLKLIKDELYAAGALYASLTGTGSCLYGIFSKKAFPNLQKIADHYKVYNLNQDR